MPTRIQTPWLHILYSAILPLTVGFHLCSHLHLVSHIFALLGENELIQPWTSWKNGE